MCHRHLSALKSDRRLSTRLGQPKTAREVKRGKKWLIEGLITQDRIGQFGVSLGFSVIALDPERLSEHAKICLSRLVVGIPKPVLTLRGVAYRRARGRGVFGPSRALKRVKKWNLFRYQGSIFWGLVLFFAPVAARVRRRVSEAWQCSRPYQAVLLMLRSCDLT
jgi:hypothetical protein